MQNWGLEVATIIKVGIANIHHTQEGWYSLYNFRFQGTKYTHSSETISDSENQYDTAGARRLHIWDGP